MNRKNLKLLADYLWNLPEGYEHFDMYFFHTGADTPSDAHISCGTAACALGHSPYVQGLPGPLEGERWFQYSGRIFDLNSGFLKGWDWCFSSDWAEIDNTPKGAAKRIYYLLSLRNEDDLTRFSYSKEDVAMYQDMTPEDVEGG